MEELEVRWMDQIQELVQKSVSVGEYEMLYVIFGICHHVISVLQINVKQGMNYFCL